MQKFFEFHRKEIITGAGVLLFMIAGAFAMIIMPSEKSPPPRETPKQNTNQEANQEANHEENQEANQKEHKTESTSPREIYVYMTGAVNKPGVYKFPEGSRIFEVVEAAGGFTDKADIAALNIAETFSDSQHIHIPVKGEHPRVNTNMNPNADTYTHITVQPNELNRKPNNSNLVDINSASESELQKLKGVGPAIAKRIFEYRKKHGRFKSAEELINVRGIGPVKLEKMKPQIIIR